jgi:hypothetical protein
MEAIMRTMMELEGFEKMVKGAWRHGRILVTFLS